MKIVQITAVVENTSIGEHVMLGEDATIYGLGDDGNIYYWGRTKTTRTEHEPDNEGDTVSYSYEYGWSVYQP